MGASGTPPAVVTWNPADKGSDIALSGGNLIASKGGVNAYQAVRATVARSAANPGGRYFEVVVTQSSLNPFISIGVAGAAESLTSFIGSGPAGWSYYQETGEKINNGSGYSYAAAFYEGNVIGVLLKNGKIYFRKNGTWLNGADVGAETGFAFSGLSGLLFPAVALYRGTSPIHVVTGRFSAAEFSGSVPVGAVAWE